MNELNFELPPERIAKSIINVTLNTQSENQNNFNNKAMEINNELSKMCFF